MEAKIKAKKAIQEAAGKRKGNGTKWTKIKRGMGHGERQTRHEITQKIYMLKGKGKRQACPGCIMLIAYWLLGSQRSGRMMTMMAISAGVCLLGRPPAPPCLPYSPPLREPFPRELIATPGMHGIFCTGTDHHVKTSCGNRLLQEIFPRELVTRVHGIFCPERAHHSISSAGFGIWDVVPL